MDHRHKIYLQWPFPEIQAGVPDCELAIAGPASEGRAWPDSVLALGQMKSLASAYASAAVVINPVMFGTGLPVKTMEALNHGQAVGSDNCRSGGLGPQFVNTCVVAQSASEFA